MMISSMAEELLREGASCSVRHSVVSGTTPASKFAAMHEARLRSLTMKGIVAEGMQEMIDELKANDGVVERVEFFEMKYSKYVKVVVRRAGAVSEILFRMREATGAPLRRTT
jgi:hypothetical protein